jgi:prolyl-tRNA synthetase
VSVLEAGEQLQRALRAAGIRVHLDVRDGLKPGAKYYEWESRGVPFRMELGPRDLAAGQVMLARRTGGKEAVPMAGIGERIHIEIDAMQQALLGAAVARREAASIRGATREQLIEAMNGAMGFVYGGWCGDATCEADIKEQTKATIRVLPDEEFRSDPAPTRCLWCNRDAVTEAVWAKAY